MYFMIIMVIMIIMIYIIIIEIMSEMITLNNVKEVNTLRVRPKSLVCTLYFKRTPECTVSMESEELNHSDTHVLTLPKAVCPYVSVFMCVFYEWFV